jgi:hypothetical protein
VSHWILNFNLRGLAESLAQDLYISITKELTEAVRVFGLHLDPKLQWKVHKKEALNKMATHTNALTRLAGSTWGLPNPDAPGLHRGNTLSYVIRRPRVAPTTNG